MVFELKVDSVCSTNQNRAKKGLDTTSQSDKSKSQPDMADVLKGLGSVKLRTVAR